MNNAVNSMISLGECPSQHLPTPALRQEFLERLCKWMNSVTAYQLIQVSFQPNPHQQAVNDYNGFSDVEGLKGDLATAEKFVLLEMGLPRGVKG